jgi:hypothetical protein
MWRAVTPTVHSSSVASTLRQFVSEHPATKPITSSANLRRRFAKLSALWLMDTSRMHFYKLKRVEAGLDPTHIPKFFNLGLIVKLLTRN